MMRVDSDTVAALGYDEAHRWLDVKFVRGHTYRYLNVPPEISSSFATAPSKGQYFNDYIRGAFLYTVLDEDSGAPN